MDTLQAFDSAITELPTATIELDIPKTGKKPTKKQMDNLKKAGEAMAAHEDKTIFQELMTPADAVSGEEEAIKDKMILKPLKIPRLTMDGFHDEYQNDPQAVKEEREESDRLRKIEQESASYMEEEE